MFITLFGTIVLLGLVPHTGRAQLEVPTVYHGSRVRITVPERHHGWLFGRVIRVERDTLFLETETYRQRYLALPLPSVRLIELDTHRRRRTERRRRAAKGAAASFGVVGFLIGLSLAPVPGGSALFDVSRIGLPLAGAAVGAGIGMAVGGFVGAAVSDLQRTEQWVPVPVDDLVGRTIVAPPEKLPPPSPGTGRGLGRTLLREAVQFLLFGR